MVNAMIGLAAALVGVVAILTLLFWGAFSFYQNYKQKRYWDSMEAEGVASFDLAADPDPIDEPKGEVLRCGAPEGIGLLHVEEKEIPLDQVFVDAENGKSYKFIATMTGRTKVLVGAQAVRNPAALPMPSGYEMSAITYRQALETGDISMNKMNEDLYEAVEEAKKVDAGLKGLREIIREEHKKLLDERNEERKKLVAEHDDEEFFQAARADVGMVVKVGVGQKLTASDLIEKLAAEYERLRPDDLHAHARACVRALKAQKSAKEAAEKTVLAGGKRSRKPKGKRSR